MRTFQAIHSAAMSRFFVILKNLILRCDDYFHWENIYFWWIIILSRFYIFFQNKNLEQSRWIKGETQLL